MFDDMNAALLEVDDLEFPTPQRNTVSRLFARFDAIFTLNQDLLLEHLYMEGRATQLPGLQGLPGPDGRIADSWVKGIWTDSGQTLIDKNLQPIYKLPWLDELAYQRSGNLLVLGAAKRSSFGAADCWAPIKTSWMSL